MIELAGRCREVIQGGNLRVREGNEQAVAARLEWAV